MKSLILIIICLVFEFCAPTSLYFYRATSKQAVQTQGNDKPPELVIPSKRYRFFVVDRLNKINLNNYVHADQGGGANIHGKSIKELISLVDPSMPVE